MTASTGNDDKERPRHRWNRLRVVWSAVRLARESDRGLLRLSATLTIVRSVLFASQLLLARSALDALRRPHSEVVVAIVPWAFMIGVSVGAVVWISAVQRDVELVAGERAGWVTHLRVLEQAARAPLKEFDDPRFHDTLQRVQSDRDRPMALVRNLFALLASAATIAVGTIALAVIVPVIVPFVLLIPLPIWVLARKRGEELYRFAWRTTRVDRERFYISDLLTRREAAAEVRVCDAPSLLLGRIDGLYRARLQNLSQIARRQRRQAVGVAAGLAVGVACIILLLAVLVGDDLLSGADAAVALFGFVLIASQCAQVGTILGLMEEASPYIDDYKQFVTMTHVPYSVNAPDFADEAHVSARNITFSYPNSVRPAIRDVTVSARAGELVAIVGPNGSGKTTLLRLLAKLYEPDSGEVRWGAKSDFDSEHERCITAVFQEAVRFHLSAGENIGIGEPRAVNDRGRWRRAADRANVHTLISQMPRSYDTILGPEFVGGFDISSGQWQRLSIARATFARSGIVLLDEPTAALDAYAERDFMQGLKRLYPNRAIVLVTHRVAYASLADRVVVMDRGRVVESGPPDELAARDGYFSELIAQFASVSTSV